MTDTQKLAEEVLKEFLTTTKHQGEICRSCVRDVAELAVSKALEAKDKEVNEMIAVRDSYLTDNGKLKEIIENQGIEVSELESKLGKIRKLIENNIERETVDGRRTGRYWVHLSWLDAKEIRKLVGR